MLNFTQKIETIKRYVRNTEGTAAIEFAFIAPIMVILYFGLASVSMLISTDRNVAHAASVAGDLSTQSATLDVNDIEDIVNATLAVLGLPASKAADVSIDIRSFERDLSDDIQEVGYAKLGSFGTKYTPPNDIAASILSQASGLVVTRISYDYQSLGYYVGDASDFNQTFLNPTLSETFFLKPRKSATVPFTGGTINCTLVANTSPAQVTCST